MKCSANCIYYTQPNENIEFEVDENGVKHVVNSTKVYCQYKNKKIKPRCRCKNKYTNKKAVIFRKELIYNG